ncbi:hypothetical protein SERLADRAFT_403327 [Serpula lacrymans var. lacrymans S7.9]|uniref:Uncharacterized protein n=1 Tax=Serpula lacrymans var. lacrymans (strain S7.9) TaxID=578457 RepID=F8PCY5_SERL9|nr:uncharacterized protein SERLADRAFT_403327 [Serpula lacrymans var. lacrymans S7.9]EGO19084.1 hypothetical protein SERLADRAFT_403327 [Serpula lacrymans var. lacrymans S7.9]
MLHFNSTFLTLPDDQDGRPVDIPVFRLVRHDGQGDIRKVADEDDPKMIVQTRTVSIGQWMFDVRSFYVRLKVEFRKRFNEKRVERYRIVEME